MTHNWTIKKRIATGFAAILALLLILAATSVILVNSVRGNIREIETYGVPSLGFAAKVKALQQERSLLLLREITAATPEDAQPLDTHRAAKSQQSEDEVAA